MDHRLLAVLAIICFAFGGAGCASQSQIEGREEVLMPQQTGSRLQRRVMVASEQTKRPKKKKESKTTAKPTPKPKPETTPEPKVEPTPEPSPTPEPETTPDRFR